MTLQPCRQNKCNTIWSLERTSIQAARNHDCITPFNWRSGETMWTVWCYSMAGDWDSSQLKPAVGGATVLGDPIWDPKTCSFCGQRLMLHLKCAANVFNSFVCNSLPTLLKSIRPIQSIQSYSIHQFSRYKIYIEHTKNGQNKHRQHIHTTNPHLSAFFSHSFPSRPPQWDCHDCPGSRDPSTPQVQ